MLCQVSKKKSSEIANAEILKSLRLVDRTGEMPELAYIVAGSRASVKVEFAPDPANPTEKLPLQALELPVGRNSKASGDAIYDAPEHQGDEWKLRPKSITVTFVSELGGVKHGQMDEDLDPLGEKSSAAGPKIVHDENE